MNTFHVQSIPKKPEYAPPLNIKVFDKRSFREVLVGCNVTKSVRSCITKGKENYLCAFDMLYIIFVL